MVQHPHTTPFVVARDSEVSSGPGLIDPLRSVYGGDWHLPNDRPAYVYANFVMSKDARISFGQPGHATAASVSDNNPYDRWLMALLRCRADAVIVGDGIVRQEPDYSCRADWVVPDESGLFAAQRRSDGARQRVLSVIVSMSGDFPPDTLADPSLDTLVATVDSGVGACRRRAESVGAPTTTVRSFGAETVDMAALVTALSTEYRARSILCEGGALVYGAMLRAGVVDDEFLTVSPTIVGPCADATVRRPSIVDGTDFTAENHPRSTLVGLRTAGDFVFLHSRYR